MGDGRTVSMYYFVGAVSEARRRDDGVARAEEKFRALLRALQLATHHQTNSLDAAAAT